MNRTTIAAERIGWPEALPWRGRKLFFSDVFGRQGVYAMGPDGSVRTVAEVPTGIT